MLSKRLFICFLPINMYITYILVTLILYIFGPWNYANDKQISVISFIIVYLFVMYLSFYIGIKSNYLRKVKTSSDSEIDKRIIQIIFLGLLSISLVLAVSIIEKGFNINDNNIFSTMAIAYTNKEYSNSFNLSAWIYNYTYFFIMSSICIGMFFIRKLKKIYKIYLTLTILMYFIYNFIYIGNQKAIGDFFIYLLSIVLIKIVKTKTKRQFISYLISILTLAISSLYIFPTILISRMKYWGVYYSSVGGSAFLDINNYMLNAFSNYETKIGIGTFIFYLSSGYYGLGLSLNLPFKWSFGYGNSFEIKSIMNRIFPMDDTIIGSYPVRMQNYYGWDAYANWHTIFPWLASDFTFFGSVLILAIVMYLYSIAWINILKNKHWINILFFTHLNVMWIYTIANNQILLTRYSLIYSIIILVIWLKKRNWQGDELCSESTST
ncbi:O-antigen polymerase [Exiguobacterium indicum]|uniref:O-antigen polymerase n=1 Tax=Exiguobacterium indicum TaxID=296995 RepID=UPI002B25C6EF|nr:O-antigen polymerase [Exiguobacterium indicum]